MLTDKAKQVNEQRAMLAQSLEGNNLARAERIARKIAEHYPEKFPHRGHREILTGIINAEFGRHESVNVPEAGRGDNNDTPASSFPSLPESEYLNDPLPETPEGNFRCPVCMSEYKKG